MAEDSTGDSNAHSTAVSMYGDGAPWAEITEATGLSASSIAHALRKAGVEPSRQRSQAQTALIQVVSEMKPDPRVYAGMTGAIMELERECGRFEAERDAAREIAAMFRDRLTRHVESTGGDASSIPHLPASWNIDPRGDHRGD